MATKAARAGQDLIEWADGQMPVLGSIRERFAAERPLEGVRIGACLHVTSETANLARALLAGGAEVALCASNPLTTQEDVAAALGELHGAQVHGAHADDAAAYAARIEAVADTAPQVTMDDGADLIGLIHLSRPELLDGLLGATEETTIGLLRLRGLQAEGGLRCPVIAVNEAMTERVFNDGYGTGQSTLDGILRATNLLLAGRTIVVFGFGRTGRGVAQRARGAGAQVIVCEVDGVAALEARMEGFEVMTALAAAERGDVFITVTGSRDVLGRAHFERMKDNAVLANAGHFDVEIDVAGLRELAASGRGRIVRPLVEAFTLADGRRLNLLAEGRVVNLAAAEGHPASVMDMSFAGQALSVEHLVRHGGELEPQVLPVPPAIDEEIARLKLASLGVEIDTLSESQRRYLTSWDR
jgi:adenosylhomocysteinase